LQRPSIHLSVCPFVHLSVHMCKVVSRFASLNGLIGINQLPIIWCKNVAHWLLDKLDKWRNPFSYNIWFGTICKRLVRSEVFRCFYSFLLVTYCISKIKFISDAYSFT
jgi:hypothetical protein